MTSWLDTLRFGAWLTRERMRLVALAVLAAAAGGLIYLVATAHGTVDAQGRPLGTDFASFYAAGTLVLDKHPLAPFDQTLLYAREQVLFGPVTPYYSWNYPPPFLLLVAALAHLPYLLALALWQSASFAAYLVAVGAVIFATARTPGTVARDRLWLLLAAAYPAVFINFGHGQNGLLTTALLGAGLAMLVERPILGGLLIGLLAYKPQFGLLIPLVLAASGNWRAFVSAALTVLALALAATLAFGPEVWRTFLATTHFTRTVLLEHGGTGWYKIQSVFALTRMWGGGIDLAYAVQGAVTVAVAAVLAWLWRGPAAFPLKAAALLIGSLLATPYSLDYDLMLLAPAIAFLAADGFRRGFAPWEKTLLALLWIVPLVTRTVAEATLIPLAVPSMLLAFVFLLCRANRETGGARAGDALHSAS